MIQIKTKSAKETQKVAEILAEELIRIGSKRVLVIALEGELGSGKTTFVQGFARSLGIKEKVLSPTFVLVKIYKLARKSFKHLIHIDCYRLDSPKDLLHLGFQDFLKDKDAIILIEWADRIRKILPKETCWIVFKHKAKNQRIIRIK